MVQDILTWSKTLLASTPLRWQYLLDTYPQDLLSIAPAPGEWSALDCLKHLADVERVSTPVRLKAFMSGEDFPNFNADDHSGKEAIDPLTEFTQLRRENLLLLEEMTPADLSREARHAKYGPVSLSHFLHHLTAHDLMHTVQAEQAMMQPFIQGTGAFDVNYDAHIIKL